MNSSQTSPLADRESSGRIQIDLLAQQRTAIDFFSALRTRIVRSAYAGQVTARPDPMSANDADRRNRRLETLSEQLEALERARKILDGFDPDGEFDRTVCEWLASFSDRNIEMTSQMTQVAGSLQGLYEAAADHLAQKSDDSTRNLDRAIKIFIESTSNLYERLTDFCAMLWQALDESRKAEVERAEGARDAIDSTLAKLEKIGKHVRLVSLNASVEASRAGDAGKGLAVIAVEFKSLAEEIQGLAATARQDIEALT